MEILLKMLYCVLFGLVTYLVRQIIISETPASIRTLLILLAVVSGILVTSQYAALPPAKEIRILLVLDAGLMVQYVMQGFVINQVKKQQSASSLRMPFVEAGFRLAEKLRRNALFYMIYLVQFLVIWKPTAY